MKTIATLAALWITATGVMAVSLPSPFTTSRSVSGQFVVFGPQTTTVRPTIRAATNASWVTLEPTLVIVSAERIKQAIWRELGVTGSWQNKVSVALRTARSGNEPINIIADRSMGSWNYRVEMPDQVTKERYLRAMVEVILLELANRNSTDRSAEIPAWLTEGLTLQLQSGHGPDLVLNTPRLNMNGVTYTPPVTTDIRQLSPLEKAHKTLLGETPLTFEELSWPAPGQIEGPEGPRYRACAQLFTYELLRLRGGKDCLREFLTALPAYLNWQMAFLQGFKPHFSRPLDIEKWWSLQSTGFASRDLIQTWTYEESWNKLTATLLAQVDVFGSTNQMPVRAAVSLQTIVRDWEPAKQDAALRAKIAELESLRTSIAPELIAFTVEYSRCLENYLKQRSQPANRGQRGHFTTSPAGRSQRELLQQLDALDAQVARMRPGTAMAASPPVGGRR
jgi:hypothetical protein